MVFKHSFYKYYLSLPLFYLKDFFSLKLLLSLMLKIGSLFKEIFPRTRISDLQIIHFYSEGSLSINFKHIRNKIILTRMEFVDIFLLKYWNTHQKLF